MSDSDLIGDARTIYRLLQTGQNRSAIERLTPFIDKADAKGRADHCARGLAWLGQAHLGLNELSEARQALRRASEVATAIGDEAGLHAIRELRHEVGIRAMAAPPKAPEPDGSVIARACAAFDTGNPHDGLLLARQARAEADSPRDEVLALLAIARSPSEAHEAIKQAAAVADRASDFNLVHAVTRAARAAGVVLPAKVF